MTNSFVCRLLWLFRYGYPSKVFANVPNIGVCFISIQTFNLSGSVERYLWCQTSASGPFKSCILLLRIRCKHKAICNSNGVLKIKEIVVRDAKMRFCLVNSKHIKFPNKHPAI
jgi:hypothetical protein